MMGSLDRIRARRAVVLEDLASARMRLAARRRMVELEVKLAMARHPSARLARHLSWLLPLAVAVAAGGGRRGPAGLATGGPVGRTVASLLATLVPILLRRLRSR
jgi:hypothetical protein